MRAVEVQSPLAKKRRFFSQALANEPLRPISAICDVAEAHGGEVRGEDVCAMAGGVHPRGHNGIGARIAHGDVFAGIVVGDAEGLHHVEGRAVGGAGVAEVAVVVHVLGFDGGIAAERVVKLERRKAVCCALAVDESQDLLGVAFGAVTLLNHHDLDKRKKVKISKLYEFDGLNKVEVKEASIGSIVAISGTQRTIQRNLFQQ